MERPGGTVSGRTVVVIVVAVIAVAVLIAAYILFGPNSAYRQGPGTQGQ